MTEFEEFFSANAVYLWGALVAAFLILGLWLLAVQIRLSQVVSSHNRLVGGVDRGNLEDALGRQISYILETKGKVERLQGDIERIDESLRFAVQRVGVVRFNPFEDTGGDQSFAIALLDARGDGLVLSSLFARRETRIFAKPVSGGQSKHTLTAEEKQAIELANTASPSAKARKALEKPAAARSADPAEDSAE